MNCTIPVCAKPSTVVQVCLCIDCRALAARHHSLLHAAVCSLQLQILSVCLSVCLSALFIATPTDRCYGTVDFWLIAVAM